MFRAGLACLTVCFMAAPGMALAADAPRANPAAIYFPEWKDRQIVSEKWIEMARTPGPANKYYGFANWYLNTDRVPLPAASAKAFWFEGNDNNIIYIDQANDVVAVVRWISTIPALNDVVGKIIASIKTPVQNDASAR
jgi:CubicO group peptidase (beta-lactamase class C family)